MNRHLTFRSGNPSLNAKTFSGFDLTTGATMTIMGTVQKTALSLLLLMTTALFTWNLPLGDPRVNGLMMLGVFGGLGVAILTVFKHHLAKYTVPAYALLQGLALGGISKFFESMYPGIVNQAVMLT
ncbi:MAG: hypothetical protein HOA15_08980, partial [Candidatus Marinimicrobia bacterium]|nr:hypothetical protein [Candidatus Neomarinimicrobiota bacterium]MBT6842022.1 hypothetical protein [Candidatus Neomarinimicrobiota bacterium]MBT7738790.1 hypothetical protein [Candidatus Neomarinimicrobiota bacterium]